MKPPLVFIIGPTASGKSALALAVAQTRGDVELISIDSAQVYTDMNIGTAKPTAAERAGVRHHLLDMMPPTQQWSVKQYCEAFNAAVADITARGRRPLAVGGTMMYVSALLSGLSDVPTAQIEIRQHIEEEARTHGWPHLHAELARVDPASAQRLPPTDAQRISRALEVFRAFGRPISEFQGARVPQLASHAPHLVRLEPNDREALRTRIAARFDAMLVDGFVDEVRDLRRRYETLTSEHPSMRTVGYRQVWAHLDGEITHDAMREQGMAATRQLAKRQLTWQRHQFHDVPQVVLDPLENQLVDCVSRLCKLID
jgi:tRNA dimethylallyltransferase